MAEVQHYSVAIRTLGKAGEFYTRMIRSLEKQTVKPDEIFVFIAEGYPLPDRVGDEIYVRCSKGMVTQRALPYDEITSEYLLLCDDDICFEPDSVERLFAGLEQKQGDAISPNVYFNHSWDLKEKFIQAFFHGIYPDLFSRYAFRVRRSAFFSYCRHPETVMETQCFAGGCILLKKQVFQSISLQDETWMDRTGYPLGEDLVFAYKLYRYGYKVLVHSASGVVHQDAQSGHGKSERNDFRQSGMLRYIIWHRTVYMPSETVVARLWCRFCFYTRWAFRLFLSVVSHITLRNRVSDRDSIMALKDARAYVHSEEYKRLPLWTVVR